MIERRFAGQGEAGGRIDGEEVGAKGALAEGGQILAPPAHVEPV